jgi:hypothetical protein
MDEAMTNLKNLADPGEEQFEAEAKAALASRITWVSVVVNSGLSVLQDGRHTDCRCPL